MDISKIKFDSNGLVPAIAQDAVTKDVLMLAYMNSVAIEKTLATGRAHFYSRSRNSLWLKGETSGNFLNVVSIYYDCDADTILMLVDPAGPACHTGERTCFFTKIYGADRPASDATELDALFEKLKKRRDAPADKSYTASLYKAGKEKILAKVAEESGELVEAAKIKDKKEVVRELADLWFHTMVLLANEGIEIEDLWKEFRRRSGTSGIDEKNSRTDTKNKQ